MENRIRLIYVSSLTSFLLFRICYIILIKAKSKTASVVLDMVVIGKMTWKVN